MHLRGGGDDDGSDGSALSACATALSDGGSGGISEGLDVAQHPVGGVDSVVGSAQSVVNRDVIRLKAKLHDLKSVAVRIMNMKKEIRSEIERILDDHDDETVEEICNRTLGLADHARANVDDVICKLSFDAFVEWLPTNSDGTKQGALYTDYLYDALISTWNIAWKLKGSEAEQSPIKESAGMALFGLSRNNKARLVPARYELPFKSYDHLLQRMGELIDYLKKKDDILGILDACHSTHWAPTKKHVDQFLRSDEVEDDGSVSDVIDSTESESIEGLNQALLAKASSTDDTVALKKIGTILGKSAALDNNGELRLTGRDKCGIIASSDLFAIRFTEHFHR